MRLFALTAALLAGAALPSGTHAQDRGAAILNGAAERYASVETLCADFDQRLEVPLLRSERTGSGRVCQARPNLFAMRFSDPEGDAIVADGESVWVYFPSNDERQVLRTEADRTAGGEDFHREFLVEPEARYEITYEANETIAGHATDRLRLVPKGPASYRAAVIWIDRGEPVLRQVRIEEENSSIRTITLQNVEFGASPGADWFTFTPPDGAVVISG